MRAGRYKAGSARRHGTWTPALLPNLYYWFKANDAATIHFSSGVLVSQMDDKSGNGRHMVQATPANQMSVAAGQINGKNVLVDNFPSLTSYMTFSGMPLTGPFAVFFIGRPETPATGHVQSPNALGQQSGGFADIGWGSLGGGGGGPRIVGEASPTLSLPPGNTSPPTTIGPVIRGALQDTALAMIWDGTTFSLYQDGVLALSTTGGSLLGTDVIDQIGYGHATGTPNQFMWNGFWAESFGILGAGPISGPNFALACQYIRNEWGTA